MVDKPCQYHHEMDASLIRMTETVAGLTQASNRLFAVGLVLICLAISTIFYAGQLSQKIYTLEKSLARLESYVYPTSYHNKVTP